MARLKDTGWAIDELVEEMRALADDFHSWMDWETYLGESRNHHFEVRDEDGNGIDLDIDVYMEAEVEPLGAPFDYDWEVTDSWISDIGNVRMYFVEDYGEAVYKCPEGMTDMLVRKLKKAKVLR